MASFAGAARFLLLTVLGFTGNLPIYSAASASTVSGWRSDLDWSALTSKLSSSASLINTSFDDYEKECVPEFSQPEPTNHALINQTSGMCLPHLFLAWEMSWPRPSENDHLDQTFDQAYQDLYVNPLTDLESFTSDSTNPSLNLPSKVLFPSVASDVVAAVNFAKEHGLEISVKNSGHSYQGASSKKNTLLLNMNRYTRYAPTGITDCDASILGTTVAEDLSNQPCLLSFAKNKSSLIRVGGGENFDKAYGAVEAVNKEQEEGYKYHLVGGAAGTVSPMGWTFQGGLPGTAGGRLFGLGVDQVVQLEMVLPNGVHVKFGPTEWEDASAEGFTVPRTKVVSGVCRSNPDEQDEEKWIWERCPEDFDIDFNDLWFAVRGGGGGTWGVVTSVLLQLHDYLPFSSYLFNYFPPTEECSAITPQFAEFKAQYMLAPSLLNVTKEHSLACGGPDDTFQLICFGDEDVMQSWTRFLDMNNLTDPALVACLRKFSRENEEGIAEYPKSYADYAVSPPDARFPGVAMDSPGASPVHVTPFSFMLVPQSWLDESEENLKTISDWGQEIGANFYTAFGGATVSASDQANSLSQAHRNAAFSINIANDEANFWSNLFPKMFDISDKTKFPSVAGSNHAGFFLTGPLKEDWTKPCPREWTFEDRSEKCISFQEVIYGTERLARLEAIKKAVDPQFMFNCIKCIGNNLPEASKSPSPDVESEPSSPADAEPLSSGNPSGEPSGASSVSSFAAAITATSVYLLINII